MTPLTCVETFTRVRLACLALIGGLACSAGSQKPAIATALDNEALRQESFEATLRVLDERPEYVDDLFAATLRHPKTLDRFLRNSARELERDEFARFTAEKLVAEPKGLKQVLIASLDAASDEPAALAAISEAMAERPQLAAIVVVQSEATLRGTIRHLMLEVRKNPQARRGFLVSLSENREHLAAIIVANPRTLRELIKAFAEQGLTKGGKELSELLESLE